MEMKLNKKLFIAFILLFPIKLLYSQTWNSLGTGTTDNVYAFYPDYNGKLVVGSVGLTGGIGNGIATWDGNSWDSIGIGTSNGKVTCFTKYNNEFIVSVYRH